MSDSSHTTFPYFSKRFPETTEPRFGKLMKDKKELLTINSEHIVPKGTSNEWLLLFAINILGLYQKTFFTAKFAKQSQRSQKGNYLFIKMLRILCPRCVLCCYLKSLTFDTPPDRSLIRDDMFIEKLSPKGISPVRDDM